LFGWGGSSKAPSIEGSVVPPSNVQDIDTGPSSLSNIRTVRASHATSDSPDPSQVSSKLDDATPPAIERISDAIALPADSDAYAEVLSDSTAAAATPEYVGYLREVCGLDYGWGPTSTMEWLFEHIHISGAIGWSASIIVLSSLIRLTMVPAMVTAQKESQKMKEIAPYLNPLREKYSAFLKEGERVKAMEVAGEMKALNKEANIKYSRMFVPLLIQFPFQFGAFRMLRASGDLPVPGFIDHPWLWNSDLSLSDPLYIAPAISAGLIFLQFKQSQKQSASALSAGSPISPNMMKIVGWVIPGASFFFMIFQPGAVQLYFMVSSIWAFVTTWALRQTPVRAAVGLSPLTAKEKTILDRKTVEIMKPPGGLRSRPGLKPASPIQVVAPSVERSSIDKGIDKVKSMFRKAPEASGYSTIKSKADNFVDGKVKEREKQRAASYEVAQRHRLAIERQERNKQGRT
jgi:YidC/Oxa1 family membrane protein insertase